MCGIAGQVALSSSPPIETSAVEAMCANMQARGPDGGGLWKSLDSRVILGHRRLSIIDLSEGGAQPKQDANGKLCISFNGEIYNYKELRAELEANGIAFRTESDSEVILEVYRAEGIPGFSRLRGMFAFLLWDAHENSLLTA